MGSTGPSGCHRPKDPREDQAYADKVRRHYAACVTYADKHVGDILANGRVVGKDFFKEPGLNRTLLGDGIATLFAGGESYFMPLVAENEFLPDLVELVTEGIEQEFTIEQLTTHPQVAPLAEKQIAHYQSVYGKPQLQSAEQVVQDIYRRHQIALRKVKIVHPPTPKISLTYK